jgi:hypothetical protein
MKLYVASSWRNRYQPDVVKSLIDAGHGVYDFRHPAPGNNGFHWSEIDSDWQQWSPDAFVEALDHDIAIDGFCRDFNAMEDADGCVLVLPSGRSSHLEAGWFVGAGRPLHILIPEPVEPELMYGMATACHTTIDQLIKAIAS